MNPRSFKTRTSLSIVAAAVASLAFSGLPVLAGPKVVVIGFDGADARLVEQWMEEGKLPNLSRLKAEGAYAPLTPTNPPQTPVSWSAFATGTNPGKTGIFDFLKKDPSRSYIPTLAFVEETKRPFALGDNTAPAAAATFFGVALILGAVVFRMIGARGKLLAALSVTLGLVAGAGGFAAADRYLPDEVPDAINNRQGKTFWGVLADAGYKGRVIRVPQNFPADEIPGGEMLSGLGVPDMRGRVGTPSYYTSEPGFSVNDNEFSVDVIPLSSRSGIIDTKINGPFNKPFYRYEIDAASKGDTAKARREARAEKQRELEERGITERIDIPLKFDVAADGSAVGIEASGQTQTLKVGEWSNWFVLDFPVNGVVDLLAPLRGMVKFKLLATSPELRIYMSPINFHPETQPVPFSYPVSFAGDLARKLGLFKTLGWAIDTWSLPTGLVEDDFFLEDMNATVDSELKLTSALINDPDLDLFVQVFEFTDRIGHMFWRYMDPQHPLYAPERAARFQEEMLKAYVRMDDIVGEAWSKADPGALFIVCSDHGFSSWRRGVNYNTWLVANGFMSLVGEAGQPKTLEDLFETKRLFENVDWSRTKAYAMGLGGIYINLAGRESRGSVAPGEEYESVRDAIIAGLESLEDTETGGKPIHKVYKREEMYNGYDPVIMPDLRVANNLGYRIGWQTALGEVPPEIFEDEQKAWSGDHCSLEPELVKGILFVNRKIKTDTPHIMDIFPSVLQEFEHPVADVVDGKSFL